MKIEFVEGQTNFLCSSGTSLNAQYGNSTNEILLGSFRIDYVEDKEGQITKKKKCIV